MPEAVENINRRTPGAARSAARRLALPRPAAYPGPCEANSFVLSRGQRLPSVCQQLTGSRGGPTGITAKRRRRLE
eukprot:8911571-Alexandrium_andersonii.AAC.1